MIGNYIKGIDQNGMECQGIIMDRVRTLTTLEITAPKALGDLAARPPQQMPFAIDAYLVLDEDAGSLHLVLPQMISALQQQERPAMARPADGKTGPNGQPWEEFVNDVRDFNSL